MTKHELGYFFVAETDLFSKATPEQRVFLCGQYQLTRAAYR
jgi:hypothetical protein